MLLGAFVSSKAILQSIMRTGRDYLKFSDFLPFKTIKKYQSFLNNYVLRKANRN
jgi:hypothetical protein